jgi:hypothetical protein
MNKPQPVKYTQYEGDHWSDWGTIDERRQTDMGKGVRFHSIKFDDGSVFDMLNGWR